MAAPSCGRSHGGSDGDDDTRRETDIALRLARPESGTALAPDRPARLRRLRAAPAPLVPCFVADGDSRLRRLTGPRVALSRPLWLLVHRELRAQPRVAAVIAWLERLAPSCRAP